MGQTEEGFTLLELLVAITLMALLSVVLLGGLRFGARVWEESERHNMRGNEVRDAQMRLREAIEQAWPYFDTTNPVRPHVRFHGDVARLAFLSPISSDLARGGYAEVELAAIETDDGLQLIMRTRHELAEEAAPYREEILLDGLSGLQISYFGGEGPGSESGWREEWQNRKELPDLVRMDVKFPSDDGRHWPAFIVAPKIEADVSCVFDPLTHFCKGR